MKYVTRTGYLGQISILSVAITLTCVSPNVVSAATPTLGCDDSMKTAFKPDGNTTVLLVKKVKKDDPYPSPSKEQQIFPNRPARFAADLCWVKLLVGPGVPGPTGAPSTSRGIGIEVWLPEKNAWNHRVHALGGGGWANGYEETVVGRMSVGNGNLPAPRIAAEEGAVTATTDSGQQYAGASFAMNPDGTVNVAGWRDWSYRSLYEQAVKTKALATAYYGSPPKYSYFEGGSGGGRQALHVAQNLPEQYDGIVSIRAGASTTSDIAQLYPELLVLRDLGGKAPSREQLEAVSAAAVAACDIVGGQHLGFILDIRRCRYDPTKDAAVLCRSDGGTNGTPTCMTRAQALVMNKVWYGLTIDGSVPDPALDNGWDAPVTGVRIWYGYPRGGYIRSLQGDLTWPEMKSGGPDIIALALGNPKIGTPDFKNATANGEDGWKTLTYAELAAAYQSFRAMQSETGSDPDYDSDLTRLKISGAKLLQVNGLHDPSAWVQGLTEYYDRVMAKMGGPASVQAYYKMFVVPGMSHGYFSGAANPNANPPVPADGQLYRALVDWVEKGVSPDSMVFTSPAPGSESSVYKIYPHPHGPQMSLPACAYPTVATYFSGDIFKAQSYKCR
ncbi:hypothetical protein ACVINW_003893 [Bradyrhizobium sp. USDA 4461]